MNKFILMVLSIALSSNLFASKWECLEDSAVGFKYNPQNKSMEPASFITQKIILQKKGQKYSVSRNGNESSVVCQNFMDLDLVLSCNSTGATLRHTIQIGLPEGKFVYTDEGVWAIFDPDKAVIKTADSTIASIGMCKKIY